MINKTVRVYFVKVNKGSIKYNTLFQHNEILPIIKLRHLL